MENIFDYLGGCELSLVAERILDEAKETKEKVEDTEEKLLLLVLFGEGSLMKIKHPVVKPS